jgi:hypothetical protein
VIEEGHAVAAVVEGNTGIEVEAQRGVGVVVEGARSIWVGIALSGIWLGARGIRSFV